jgi:hypothetical protein
LITHYGDDKVQNGFSVDEQFSEISSAGARRSVLTYNEKAGNPPSLVSKRKQVCRSPKNNRELKEVSMPFIIRKASKSMVD